MHLTDNFAQVNEVWDRLVQNGITSIKPGAGITVDEQLFPTSVHDVRQLGLKLIGGFLVCTFTNMSQALLHT